MSNDNEFVFVVDMDDEEFNEEVHREQVEQLYNDVDTVVDFDFSTRVNRGVTEFVKTVYYVVPEDMDNIEVREEISDAYREIVRSY